MPGQSSPKMLPGCAYRMAQSNPGPEGIVDNGGWPQTPCDHCGVSQGEPCLHSKLAEQATQKDAGPPSPTEMTPAGQPSAYSEPLPDEELRQARTRIRELEADLGRERALVQKLHASLAKVAGATVGGA